MRLLLKRILYISVLVFYFCPFTFGLYSQPSITWQRTFDGLGGDDIGYDICDADNGNFYTIGNTIGFGFGQIYVLKLSPFGDTLWSRKFGDTLASGYSGLAITSSNDGGCVLTGRWDDSSFTIKLNIFGNVIWKKFYEFNVNVYLRDIFQTEDGGYIACGSHSSSNGYILKIDSFGNLQWDKLYPSVSGTKTFTKIIKALDSGYIISGYDLIFGDSGRLTKINENGDVVWEKHYGFGSLARLNNSYLIDSSIYFFGAKSSFLRKLDLSGNLLKTIPLNTSIYESIDDIKALNDNKYVALTLYQNDTTQKLYSIIRTIDSSGNTLAEKEFLSPDYTSLRTIHITQSSGRLLSIGDADFNLGSRKIDFFIVRTDTTLKIIGLNNESQILPKEFMLYQNFPNPFNPITRIRFEISKSAIVNLVLYNLQGKELEQLVQEYLYAGTYNVSWNAQKYSTGIYFYKLVVGDISVTKKMILIK